VREPALYAAAAAAYIGLGVAVPELLFSWPVGVGFLLVCVWLLPALVRRLR
jgi:hypothetical protein